MSTSHATSNISSNNVHAGGDVNMNTVVTNNYAPQQDVMEILKDHAAFEALHDSAERFDPPKCHPETRIAVLDLIDQWAHWQDPQDGKPILWLSGAAGAGKSAIAQTLIERWKKDLMPTACFFFWRTSPKRNQKTRLIPTIAFQLIKFFPTIKPSIEAVIRAGDIFERSLQAQMEELVVKPLRDIISGWSPLVVVIDGLDECCVDLPKSEGHPGQDHEAQQKEILESLAGACQQILGLRFFVASRPERQIRQSFGSEYLKANTSHISLNDSPNAHEDICLFLDCKFTEIRNNNPGLDSSWPSEEQLSLLIKKASGQFIYPSTVMKFIGCPRKDPQLCLEAVLGLKPKLTDPQAEYPFGEIDALYHLVLGSIVPASWPIVKGILGDLCYGDLHLSNIFSNPKLVYHEPEAFRRFLFLGVGELHMHLADVHSILEIPAVEQESHPIRFIHATLSEFLQDQVRSRKFFIDRGQYYLRCELLLQEHVQQFLKDPALYTQEALAGVIAWYLRDCPPSKKLKVDLWNLIKGKGGTYPDLFIPSSLEPNSFNHSLIVDCKFRILEYLEACNIPEIEPSWFQRVLVRGQIRLVFAKVMSECTRLMDEWGREERERERRREERLPLSNSESS